MQLDPKQLFAVSLTSAHLAGFLLDLWQTRSGTPCCSTTAMTASMKSAVGHAGRDGFSLFHVSRCVHFRFRAFPSAAAAKVES